MSEEGEVSEPTGAEPVSSADNSALPSDAGSDSEQRPAGYHPVDPETASPEEVKQRINYLYRQVRDQGRTLGEYRNIAQTQSQKIEELMSGVGHVVSHLESQNFADHEARLMQQVRAAHESGDTDAFLSANDRLTQIRVQKALAEQQKAQKPKQKQEAPPQSSQTPSYRSASEIVSESVADGDMLPEEGRIIESWASEKDASGQPLRPWVQTRNPNDPLTDPHYRRALIESAAVFDETSPYAKLSFDQKLAEIDRRMGIQKSATSQNVMGGGLTTPRKTSKITLSPKQQEIAIRTKFGGPKAKSDADHLDAYRKQIERVQSKKGAR